MAPKTHTLIPASDDRPPRPVSFGRRSTMRGRSIAAPLLFPWDDVDEENDEENENDDDVPPARGPPKLIARVVACRRGKCRAGAESNGDIVGVRVGG